jgi:CBS domain-containing protein
MKPPARPVLTARDIMNTHVESLRPDVPIADAVQLLIRRGYSGAPVLDEGGRLVGILSELDCLRVLAEAAYEGWPEGDVRGHMQKEVKSVSEEVDVLVVCEAFVEGGVRRLPVLDRNGQIVGLITRRDLMRGLDALERAHRGRPLTTYELIAHRRGQ